MDVENTFSFENNVSIHPYYSIQEFVSSHFNFEDLLQMDFNFLENSCADPQEIMLIPSQELKENLKGIQDELMEDSSLSDLLLMAAEAIEAGNIHFASLIAMRLKNILSDQENGENPLDRLAFYFTQALLYKCLSNSSVFPTQTYNTISAFQLLQDLSPYVKFAHFTANQAILEATEGTKKIHVIDFDVMEGIQWPSLMVELAARADATCLRITAILVDKQSFGNIQKTGFRLQELADSIRLSFFFDQILITNEEDFEGIQIQEGHTLIANCMMNQLHMPQRGLSIVKTFLNGLRKLSPKVVILVEEELFNMSKDQSMSFVEFFSDALEHYAAISDSLISGFSKGCELALRVIEKEFLRLRILESLKQFPCGIEKKNQLGENCLFMNGFRPIPMSSCNVTQAKHLVSLFNGGYWVQNAKCRLELCWKSRPLTIASIWVPTIRSNSREIISVRSPS
ncbi:hypothetical protein M9H77_13032 [Catharanthus roseus]|uniref:Uncharacterized protein n=1 Tax=Catharanthus roseus TaxID=4058 RepID=A0ACC0BJ91_CATRO|nr:hypothetical protein M9H77_13032 [Catharanthus roseus]